MSDDMNLPESFVSYTRQLLGTDFDAFVEALAVEPPVSLRVNTAKYQHSVETETVPVPWSSTGVYLPRRLTFTFDPLFHAGAYYVQEASSMFVEQAVKQHVLGHHMDAALDLCAAPGGKSTLLRSLLPDDTLLVANEVMRQRSQILAENLTKWGHPSVVVTQNDPADFAGLTAMFDLIVSDVPCSGEGMFRKDQVAVDEWNPANVELCRQRQQRIISDIWDCLKPGGILIYSTCTFNTAENEENIAWISHTFGAEVLPVNVEDEWGVTGNLLEGSDFPVYRFLPHRTCGEGFFMAVLRKPGDSTVSVSSMQAESGSKPRQDKNRWGKKEAQLWSKAQLQQVESWLTQSADMSLLTEDSTVVAFPAIHAARLVKLKSQLRVIHAGVPLAELKGKNLVPLHTLAMSTRLSRGVFPEVELTYEQAIAYLRKEAVVLPSEAARGMVLLTYRSVPLGFVKNIGNRANNLYPQEWRIRSGYMPDEIRLMD